MLRKTLQIAAAISVALMLVSEGYAAQEGAGDPGGKKQAKATPRFKSTTWYVDPELIHLLEKDAKTQLFQHLQDQGDSTVVEVKVTLDPAVQLLTVDFGAGFLPVPDGVSTEFFLPSLASGLRFYAEQAGMPVHNVRFLFQGMPLEHYFPEELVVPVRARESAAVSTALVSSGHGLVRVFPSQRWEFQRPLAFGHREDWITPPFGEALQQLLVERGGLTVYRARSRSVEPHDESLETWERMSSRYHVKEVLPHRTEIWNSLPNDTRSDREVREDIRTRPLYANHLQVGTLVSLHTNGHINADVRGVEVYYHEAKPNDRDLAEKVICSMRELIHSQAGYEQFPIRSMANPGRHGENRIGNMPSVLVEMGYHTNAEDAAALQDPAFQTASMKGVEKGVRLYREGKACMPLTLRSIDDLTLPPLSSGTTAVHFEGNPQFPLTLSFIPASCTEPGACRPSERVVTEPSASPVQMQLGCEGSGTGSVKWRTVMQDADGVMSGPVEHMQSCSS